MISSDRAKMAWLTVPIIFVSLLAANRMTWPTEPSLSDQDPARVLQAYVRATYARDFVAAYRFISAEDRKVRDLNRYVQQRGSYGGFILEAARKLSEYVEIQTLKTQGSPNRVHMSIKYLVPDPQKLAPLLFNWDPYRLNALPPAEQKRLIDSLDQRGREGSFAMSQGEETFDLVKESNDWRIFLNWAAGVKIPLRLDLSKSTDLDVALSKNEFVLQPGEVFQIVLKIKNHAKQPVTARIAHLVEPSSIADFLDFVQCSFLLPVTVQPEKEQEFSGTYMLRGSLPEGIRQLNLTYDFRQLQ